MKKIILCLLLTLVIIFNFTGCSPKISQYNNSATSDKIVSSANQGSTTAKETSTNAENGNRATVIEQIKAKLDKALIDEGSAASLTDEAFQLLAQYLKQPEGKGLTSDKIKELSEYIHINEWNSSRIIEYTQPPEIFGNSGKSSWQLFQYKSSDKAFIIEKNVPLHLEYFRPMEDGAKLILYTYGTDFEVQPNKVYIRAYKLEENRFTVIKSLNCSGALKELWGCNEETGRIYSKKNYTAYIELLSENGGEVTIKGVSTDPDAEKVVLILALAEDGLYHIKK